MPREVYIMQQHSERKKFAVIQALRGLAACMVVVFHSMAAMPERFAGARGWGNGEAGVDLFFTISGFVMAASYSGERLTSPGRYLTGRLIRLAPLYWIMTSLMLFKMDLVRLRPSFEMDRAASHDLPSVSSILHSLLFFHIKGWPILAQGWTLSYEMFFYVMFTIALMLGFGVARFMFPALIACVVVGLFRTDSWPEFTILFDPLLLEFLAGMGIGFMVKSKINLPARLSSLIGAVSLACLFSIPLYGFPFARVLVWGVSAAMLVGAVVFLEDKISQHIPKFILTIGDASYSLYLSHAFVITVVVWIFRHHSTAPHYGLTVAACLASSVCLSLGVYRFLEKPMTESLTRKILAMRSQQGYAEKRILEGDVESVSLPTTV